MTNGPTSFLAVFPLTYISSPESAIVADASCALGPSQDRKATFRDEYHFDSCTFVGFAAWPVMDLKPVMPYLGASHRVRAVARGACECKYTTRVPRRRLNRQPGTERVWTLAAVSVQEVGVFTNQGTSAGVELQIQPHVT
jgi:hypothetical protein